MSLIPPVPLILSKLRFHVMSRYKDDPDLERVLAKLGPYYRFSVKASFRSLENGATVEYNDMKDYLESDVTEWICIDTALNMYTRLKNKLREVIMSPGVLRIALVQQPEEPIPDRDPTLWYDLLIDEIPLNVRGIVDEDGKEMTFYAPRNETSKGTLALA